MEHYFSLTVANDIVYVDPGYGKLYAFNASTAKQLWVAAFSSGDVFLGQLLPTTLPTSVSRSGQLPIATKPAFPPR